MGCGASTHRQGTSTKEPTVMGIEVATAAGCDETSRGKFSDICSLDSRYVFLAPYNAPKMVIYDVVTGRTTSVEVAQAGGCQATDGDKFGGIAALGKDKVCLAPWSSAKKMVLYDVGSKKVQAVEVCEAAGCHESSSWKFGGICTVGENQIVLAPQVAAKKMVVYNTTTRKAIGVDVCKAAGCSENDICKFWGVCSLGDEVFLAPYNAPKMVIYNVVTGRTTCVEVAQAAGLQDTDRVKFVGIAALGKNIVCLAPLRAKKMVLYDVGSKKVQAVEVCEAAGCEERSSWKFGGICTVGENQIVLAPRDAAKKMVVYNTDTRKATGVNVCEAAGCSETAVDKFWGVCALGDQVFLSPRNAAKMVKWTGVRKLHQATKDLLLAATSGEQTLESQREAFQKEQEDKANAEEAKLQQKQEAEMKRLKDAEAKLRQQQEAEMKRLKAELQAKREQEMKVFNEQEAKVRELLRKQSQEAGISAAYVYNIFPQEVREVLPSSEDPDPNFRTIRKSLMERPDGKPGKGEETVCPRDGLMGSSFMDAEVRAHRAKATHFVSWCWGYSMGQFGSAIRGHFQPKGQDLSGVFLWVCFFCNNQYRIFRDRTLTGTQELSAAFESHLVGAGQMLVMLDDFMQPQYIGRVWCIFEMYISIDRNIPHEIILPESAQASFAQARITPASLKAHFEALDVQNAKASNQNDEEAIKAIIKKHIGFNVVNSRVRDNLSKWVVDAFTKVILG